MHDISKLEEVIMDWFGFCDNIQKHMGSLADLLETQMSPCFCVVEKIYQFDR